MLFVDVSLSKGLYTHNAPAYPAVQCVASYLALAGEGKAGPAWKPVVTEIDAAIQSEINNIATPVPLS